MNKQLTKTSFLRKPYSKPQMTVVEIGGDDIISTSNQAAFSITDQGFEEEDW